MSVNLERELVVVADRIRRDAPSWRVDFADPSNAFTVWADHPSRMLYCGGRTALDEAFALAEEHVNLQSLYIATGPLDVFGVMKFENA